MVINGCANLVTHNYTSKMKRGFDFYRADTDRFSDRKIKRLRRSHSCVGICVYEYLLAEIFRDKGYYIEFNNDLIFDLAEYWMIDEAIVSSIVEDCITIGLFELINGVLTSRSIQERYRDMCISSKRKVRIDIEKDLIGWHKLCKTPLNSEESTQSSDKTYKNSEEMGKNSEDIRNISENIGNTQELSEGMGSDIENSLKKRFNVLEKGAETSRFVVLSGQSSETQSSDKTHKNSEEMDKNSEFSPQSKVNKIKEENNLNNNIVLCENLKSADDGDTKQQHEKREIERYFFVERRWIQAERIAERFWNLNASFDWQTAKGKVKNPIYAAKLWKPAPEEMGGHACDNKLLAGKYFDFVKSVEHLHPEAWKLLREFNDISVETDSTFITYNDSTAGDILDTILINNQETAFKAFRASFKAKTIEYLTNE